MKTQLTELQKAVLIQLSGDDELTEDTLQTLQDVSNNGADCGYGGFIYYTNTCGFYDDNSKLIINKLKDDYQDIGYNSITEMVKSFNCFKEFKNDEIELFLINLLEDEDDITTIKNGLAWYALEETARELTND
jgi:hypothetical protein